LKKLISNNIINQNNIACQEGGLGRAYKCYKKSKNIQSGKAFGLVYNIKEKQRKNWTVVKGVKGLVERSYPFLFICFFIVLIYLTRRIRKELLCAKFAGKYECKCGGQYQKVYFCGKEWCKVCGKKHSASHKKRIANLMKRVKHWEVMGYFVIGISNALRQAILNARAKDDLQKIQSYIRRYVIKKRLGAEEYHIRAHYQGDKSGDKFLMHWNAIFNADEQLCDLYQKDKSGRAITGLLKQKVIDNIREGFRIWIYKKFAKKYNLSEDDLQVVVSYKYAKSNKKKKHIVNYITRPTLHNEEYSDMYIKAVSNMKKGGYANEPSEAVGELEILKRGLCPKCRTPLRDANKTICKVKIGRKYVFYEGGRRAEYKDLGDGWFKLIWKQGNLKIIKGG